MRLCPAGGVPVQNASAPDLPEVPDIMDHTAVAGTYRYMAPEVYNGVGCALSPKP